MTKTIHALYKDGVLKPLESMQGFSDDTEVEITIATVKGPAHPLMRFAGILNAEDADSMMTIIEDEFEKVNPDEWKD
jgi:predicted DNA-binding antitoxin AbrB/MazE fold protein